MKRAILQLEELIIVLGLTQTIHHRRLSMFKRLFNTDLAQCSTIRKPNAAGWALCEKKPMTIGAGNDLAAIVAAFDRPTVGCILIGLRREALLDSVALRWFMPRKNAYCPRLSP
jgi:hypothetical protein